MREREIDPALTPEEWGQRFFRRGEVTGFRLEDDAVSLMRQGFDGSVDAVRLEEDEQKRAAAALALACGGTGLNWQDHDDQLITSMLLSYYERGIPFEELGDQLRTALRGVLDRSGWRAARIAALLPPRPEEDA